MAVTSTFRVADLAQNAPTRFDLRPSADETAALARELDLIGLSRVTFSGQIAAQGRRDWVLTARLGASVVQPCIVTLDPVKTRIDTDVTRTYIADLPDPEEAETEMPEDDTIEPLGRVIDVGAVMAEALALALPLYPRKPGVELDEAVFAGPGIAPMTDEDAKPFAGLSGLRDALNKKP